MTRASDAEAGDGAGAQANAWDGLRPSTWLILAIAGMLILLVATSPGLAFFYDEWAFLTGRDIGEIWRPHNGHLVGGLVVIHRGIAAIFGTDSYAPFLGVLWACHVLATACVWRLLREVGSNQHAAAGAMVFAVLGSGWENLLWAFQIGFVLSTALGCLALAVAPRRPALAALLLTGSVFTTSIGLVYLGATAVRLMGTRALAWLAIPAAVYGGWSLAFGVAQPGQFDPSFVFVGILAAVGGLAGANLFVGAIMAAAAVPLMRADRMTVTAALGLLGMYVALATVRSDLGLGEAASSRYIYVAAPFALILAVSWWRAFVARGGPTWVGPLIVAIAIAANLNAFRVGREGWTGRLAHEATLPVEERLPYAP